MDLFQDNNQRRINDALAIVKLASLFLCAIEIFNMFVNSIYTKKEYYITFEILAMLVMLVIVYWIWSFVSVKIYKFKYVKAIQLIETVIFIIIYSMIIFATNGHKSNLKFLFLFSIITSTIQIGKNYGIIVASISSAIILIMDIINIPVGINIYLQNDLTLVGVFILIAWILGYYVKFERDTIFLKNLQLESMGKELKENSKKREYMEELLLKNNACYDLLIENSNNAIFVHSDGKIIFANESASRLVQAKSVDDILNSNILSFIPLNQKNEVSEKFSKIYNEKATYTFEHDIENNFYEIVGVRNISTLFRYEGEAAILTILHDITSEKQVKKLEDDMRINTNLLNETREFNKIITEFFSNISHELKTPLNVIFSAIQLLSVYRTDSISEYENKQEKYLKVVKQNCYRLMRLINNILDMTKLDSGFLKLNRGNYDVVSVVENIVLSVASYAESRGINLVFDTDTEEKLMAFDPDKIERIVLNLLSNAIKFTNYGGEIFVTLTDYGDRIKLSVKDTGVGIPEDKLEVIFERFAQVNKTFKRNQEGSGIGLSLVKSFVEMHRGTINIQSKLGYGSEFIIELPVEIITCENLEDDYIYESNIERINIEFSDIYS